MMNKKSRSNEIMWCIIGIYFIAMGLVSIKSLNALTGTFVVLAGVTLFPHIYKNFDSKYKKYIRIIVPGVFYKMAVISAVIPALISGYADMNSKTIPEPETIVTEENFEEDAEPENDQGTEIKSLHLSESEIEMEINSSKEIILEVSPENFEIQDLELCSSNDDVAFLEKSESQNENGKLKLQLKSESEGECEVFVKSPNDIESNRVLVKVTDSQKYEDENDQEDDSQAEEPSQEETAQQEETIAQENYQKTQETKPKTDNSTNNKSQQNGNSKPNTNNTHGTHLYCTPKGKRYHFDPNCGGKNSRETTWAEAQAKGLTPCKKCAK